jgi:hypothetical protein
MGANMQRIITFILFLTFIALHIIPTFAADTKISGESYPFYQLDLTNNGSGKGYNKFDLGRVYVNVTSKLSEEVSIRVTMDVDKMANETRDFYLKYAYLDWNIEKFIPYSTMRFGLQSTGWIGSMEKVWGRRYVAKVLLDQNGILSSADYGFSYNINFPSGYGNASLLYLQGPGYKAREENRYKDISAFFFVRPLVKLPDFAACMLGGYYYSGYSDKADITSQNNKDRLAGMATFAYGGIFKFTTEYFKAWERIDPGAARETEKDGISLFGEIKFPMAKTSFLKKMALVGRYDLFDPNSDTENDEQKYVIAGVEWEVIEGFNLMPNFQRMKTEGEKAEDTLILNALFKF